MNKKIILLMLALPLILMLSLFTASDMVSLVVPIPVTGIELETEEIVYVDLEDTELRTVSYTIYPLEAANQDVTYSTQPDGDAPYAVLEFENNKIRPVTCGTAKVTVTTVDGGYSAGFTVIVTSKSLQSITSSLDTTVIEVGQTAQISTVFNPVNYQFRQVEYTVVEGDTVATVDSQGRVKGIGVGTAKIRVNSFVNKAIYSDVEITVESAAPITLLDESVVNTIFDIGGEIALFVDPNAGLTNADITVTVSNPEAVSYTLDLVNKKLLYTFTGNGVCEVTFTISTTYMGKDFTDTCTVTRMSDIQVELGEGWDNVNGLPLFLNQAQVLHFTVLPSGAEVAYDVAVSGPCADGVTVTREDGKLIVTLTEVDSDMDPEELYVIVTLTITPDQGEPVVLTQEFAIVVFAW